MAETLEQIQARHKKEQRDLQSQITQKKKNATKKTRKAVNNECAELEKRLKERQELELKKASGEQVPEVDDEPECESESEPEPEPAVQDVTKRLESTTIDSSLQPQNLGKKAKGSRQKARLARRAAEVKAAAIAAESEAANMVNHRAIEREYMVREFETHSLEEKEIAPNGHCLFSSVADQLEINGIPLESYPGIEPTITMMPYKIIRAVAADYIESHRHDYEDFIEKPFGEYVYDIRETGVWGGEMELDALAKAYGVEIKVVQEGPMHVVSPDTDDDDYDGKEKKTLWLAYYKHQYAGEHYNSLRKTKQ
ncbi:hypothetical protein QBC38DRAFT_469773 [Podospora fimiseda]|uniref:OTU domain-containing protein n=1 Tax=Podospora fimiseda TaxID=252190 RepID=A0AAN7H2K8_9PEZI|nr:hypothetical protein QBC38DRAFT_469773 [Podospora fimiseda]